MNDTEKLTNEEVAKRITIGMGLVYDLYNEVVPLLRLIRECVESSTDAVCLNGTSYKIRLDRKKSRRTPADSLMTTDLGLAFELDCTGTDEVEEDDDAIDEESSSDVSKLGMQVSADSRFLLFRVQLYDRFQAEGGCFKPSITGVVLSNVKRMKSERGKNGEELPNFKIKRGMFLAVLRKLDPLVAIDQTVKAVIGRGSIYGNVAAAITKPLATFDSEEAVATFVKVLLPSD